MVGLYDFDKPCKRAGFVWYAAVRAASPAFLMGHRLMQTKRRHCYLCLLQKSYSSKSKRYSS